MSISKGKKYKGSFTLEMAVVLPIMASALVFLLFHFRILQLQQTMAVALQYTSRCLAVECFLEPEEKKDESWLMLEAYAILQKQLDQLEAPVGYINYGRAGISLIGSEFEGDEVALHASYTCKFAIPIFGRLSYDICQSSVSRKWIGDVRLEAVEDSKERWVYITPYGEAYHETRNCSYLDLSIRAVSSSKVSEYRNQGREKYRVCPLCRRLPKADMVYITDYGTNYHKALSCSGLKRTLYCVKIEETGSRYACGKCYGKE